MCIIREIEIKLRFFFFSLLQNGNIAEALLREGFARCVDWSIASVTGGPEKLRAAEKLAKEKKLRLWTDYKPSGPKVWEGYFFLSFFLLLYYWNKKEWQMT